jgi:predicted nucleic acid-binding protein
VILHLDTTALIKLHVQEAGSKETRKTRGEGRCARASIVAYTETQSAFARLLREGISTPKRHEARSQQFNTDWESWLRVELGHSIARTAGELAEVYALRGFDAIHLASALWLNDTAGGRLRFAAFDTRLHAAAERAGLVVVD